MSRPASSKTLSKTLPIVAIVGRPNVGKSTLFNGLVGERISIVQDTPGVTRDRIYAQTDWAGRSFTLIDTGGIEPESKDAILSDMRQQAQIAIDTADVIVFVTDVRQGATDADDKVASMLRKSGKPCVLAVNKVDNFAKQQADVYEFYNIGMGDPFPVSAVSKTGIGDLLDEVVSHLPEGQEDEEEDEIPKIAVVGKPNVGKSSLINRLLGQSRMIVSDIAGTTRDAVDSRVRYDKKDYIFIDTAGLRRKAKVKEEIERYSVIRTLAAVERCDIAVIMIDATEGVSEQDAKIAGLAHEKGKGIIIAVNKWDAVEDKTDKTMKEMTDEIKGILSFIPYAEMIFISAQTGQRIDKLFKLIDIVSESRTVRVPTGVCNEILTRALAVQQVPQDKGKRLRIYYMTQVSVKPPTFVLFVNDKQLTHFSYTRFLENRLREVFGFRGTDIVLLYRERGEKG